MVNSNNVSITEDVPAVSPRQPLKPIVKWSGGKKDELNSITPYIPNDINVYLEPFIGGGAVYFHLNPERSVITDVHKDLIDFYQAIKDGHSNEILQYMENHPNEEGTYYSVRSSVPETPVENGCKFYYLRKTCFRGMMRYNRKGEFNIPFGRYKTYNYDILKEPGYEDILQRTEVKRASFEYIFENYNDPSNFMFLDPPYDSKFTDYGYCSFGKEEHKKLAQCFKETSIRCLMIIGRTPFIEELYEGYIVGEYDKKYRFKLHSGRVGDEINTSHIVIKNY